MKRLLLIIAILTTATGASQSYAQESHQGMAYYKSSSMRELNDKLCVDFEVGVNRQAISGSEALRFIPVIVAGENKIELPDVLVYGQNKSNVWNRRERLMGKRNSSEIKMPHRIFEITPEGSQNVNYNIEIPYEMWMDSAKMILYVENLKPANRNYLIAVSMANRVQLSPRTPYVVQPMVNYIEPQPESKTRNKQGQAFLDFQVGRSEIVPTYRRNPEELQNIRAALDEVTSNPDVKVNGLFIEGYASPDGKLESNDRLSRERSYALMEYIVKNFNLPIGRNNIRTSSVAEDWDGLRKEVEVSELTHKEQILNVIDSNLTPDQKEAKLRQLPGVWQSLIKDYFPQLRRVEYQIDFTVKDFTLDETKALIGKNSILLSQLELYNAAMSYPKGSAEFDNILLEVIPGQYKDDATAAINAAAAMIQRGETATAKRFLEKYADNVAAWNNLGAIHLIEGDLDKAQELLTKAIEAGVVQAKQNLEEVEKKRADNIKMERYKK